MRSVLSSFLVAWALALVGARADPVTEIHVSPRGAVQTLSKAVGIARDLRKDGRIGLEDPVTILVESGDYFISTPLVLTAADSHLQFVGMGGKAPRIIGGVRMGPFRIVDKGLWAVDVPDWMDFDQLWVGRYRAQRARTPNRHFLYMQAPDQECPRQAFFGDRQDLAGLTSLSAGELQRVVIAFWSSWDMGYGFVESFDSESGRVKMDVSANRSLFHWQSSCPRYSIENYRAALDAPGEWFLDFDRHVVYYVPRDDEVAEKTFAYVPTTDCLVRMQGDFAANKPVEDVGFRNIDFGITSARMRKGGWKNGQCAANLPTAAISASFARNVRMDHIRVSHVGVHGIWIGEGCGNVQIRHSLVSDTGAGGVYIGSLPQSRNGRSVLAENVELSDSIVRQGGRQFQGAVGVWIGNARNCRVVHNDIYDFYYTGVSLGWTWGYGATLNRDNHIDGNRIHHIGQRMLSDLGGVYVLGDNAGSTINGNWIHDVSGYGYNGASAWGIYFDEGAHGITVSSNLVERCPTGAVHQHYGKDNLFVNNIFASFDSGGAYRSRKENHVSYSMYGNIFWWKNPSAVAYAGGHADTDPGAQVSIPTDSNLYWCVSGTVASNAFRGVDWSMWRGQGADVHGMIADPKFADPAHEDWRIDRSSPAFVLGFSGFDPRNAGVGREDAHWDAVASCETWDNPCDIPEPPVYRCQRVRYDCEHLALGRIENAMDVLTPWFVGGVDALRVIEPGTRGGRRALMFVKDRSSVRHAFEPHLRLPCDISAGTAVVSFWIKSFSNSVVQVQLRDTVSLEKYIDGPCLTIADGVLSAGNQVVSNVRDGIWYNIEFVVPVDGKPLKRWICRCRAENEEMHEAIIKCVGDFRRLTWIGFMTYGEDGTAWCLDDFELKRVD